MSESEPILPSSTQVLVVLEALQGVDRGRAPVAVGLALK